MYVGCRCFGINVDSFWFQCCTFKGTRTECRQRTECRHGLVSKISAFSLSLFSPFLDWMPIRKCEPLLLTPIVILSFERVNGIHWCIVWWIAVKDNSSTIKRYDSCDKLLSSIVYMICSITLRFVSKVTMICYMVCWRVLWKVRTLFEAWLWIVFTAALIPLYISYSIKLFSD